MADTQAEPPHEPSTRVETPLGTASIVPLRTAVESAGSPAARGKLVDALIAVAGQSLSGGNETAALEAVSEAEGLLPARPSTARIWRRRVFMLHRIKASLAQKQQRHADAVAAFEAALAALPSISAGDSDARAARLQLYVQRTRSRLALGQAKETVAEMRELEKMMAALDGPMPPRAIETIRAAVLANAGMALAMLGRMNEAEARFATSVAAIDRLKEPALATLRDQVLKGWAGALRTSGRAADADAMLAAFGGPSHHDDRRGRGRDHSHDHNHGQNEAHKHCDGHHHHEGCGCTSHGR